MKITLKNRLEKLCYRSKVDIDYIQMYHTLEKAYCSPSRHYHNFSHLDNMYHYLDRQTMDENEKSIIEWVIWWHDYVYISTQNDNEQRSADAFKKYFKEINHDLSIMEIATIREMILATKTHNNVNDHNTSLLLDLDLSILGTDKIHYLKYTEEIRKEYNSYSDKEYTLGRKKFVEYCLSQENIYKTDYFKKTLEDIAIFNLKNELLSLDRIIAE